MSRAEARTPRDFCQEGYPWPSIADLSDGDRVSGCYVVHARQQRETRQNKPYLRLVLGDRSGSVEAVVWEDAERAAPMCEPEAVIGVRARVGSYQDRIQLTVEEVVPLAPEGDDLRLLLPASERSTDSMIRELDKRIGSVRDPGLRSLLKRAIGARGEYREAYQVHPAAKRNHHAYLGGLLEHSLSLAGSCEVLAGHYQGQGIEVDRDLLTAGALLHDIGKVREIRRTGSFAYTDAGHLVGHIVMGVEMVSRLADGVPELDPGRLQLLLHLIASHQGRHEWASPAVPRTMEAMLLHAADDLDAKLNQAARHLAGVDTGGWTEWIRPLERALFRAPPAPDPEGRAARTDDDTIDLFRPPDPA